MKELKVSLKWEYTLESKFTTAYKKALINKWYFAFKIPDWWLSQKPYDMIVVINKETYHIEIKMIKWDTFYMSQLRPNQYASLKHIHKLNGNAIVIVHKKWTNSYKIIPFEVILRCPKNEWICILFDN